MGMFPPPLPKHYPQMYLLKVLCSSISLKVTFTTLSIRSFFYSTLYNIITLLIDCT